MGPSTSPTNHRGNSARHRQEKPDFRQKWPDFFGPYRTPSALQHPTPILPRRESAQSRHLPDRFPQLRTAVGNRTNQEKALATMAVCPGNHISRRPIRSAAPSATAAARLTRRQTRTETTGRLSVLCVTAAGKSLHRRKSSLFQKAAVFSPDTLVTFARTIFYSLAIFDHNFSSAVFDKSLASKLLKCFRDARPPDPKHGG